MPGPIPQETWIKFELERRSNGGNISRAAREVGISRSAGMKAVKGTDFPRYRTAIQAMRTLYPAGATANDGLCDEARRALTDFAYFRRRYFGRVDVPWATHTANLVAGRLETQEKEFMLCNAPPSVGKSTFWTIDLPAWLIVRNRAIRIMLGSASQTIAAQYAQQLRRELEREVIMHASDDDIKKGLAFDAEATLVDDFGGFKPPRGEAWKSDEFVVRQVGDEMKGKKEPTVSAYGADSTFIGHRVDVAIWDDLVSNKNTLNPEARERLKDWWPKYGESRIEPGGAMILQGQRLHAEDLYKTVADIEVTDYSDIDDEGWGEPVGTRKKYVHVRYKAHYDEHCRNVHHPTRAVPYDPDLPDDSGCLLDPRRLTFRELMAIRDQDKRNYLVTYQQEDADPSQVLVPGIWVKGGRDPETGEVYPGCWDEDRVMGVIPQGLTRPFVSVVTADPSPSKYWSVMHWAYHVPTEQRFLIDHYRGKMGANDFLDWYTASGTFGGLLEDWWQRSVKQKVPITHVVVEQNARNGS